MRNDDEDDDSLTFARDVMFVYRNIDQMFQAGEPISASRRALHTWATNEKNRDAFFKDIVPKAQDAIAKMKLKSDPDSIIIQERRSISTMREILEDAIKESQAIEV